MGPRIRPETPRTRNFPEGKTIRAVSEEPRLPGPHSRANVSEFLPIRRGFGGDGMATGIGLKRIRNNGVDISVAQDGAERDPGMTN
jgi:hypothetical protein